VVDGAIDHTPTAGRLWLCAVNESHVIMQQQLIIHLTFRGPCIVIYSYNATQRDALFLNFILVKNSTCFGQIYCPSSGVLILYSQQQVYVILVMLPSTSRWQHN